MNTTIAAYKLYFFTWKLWFKGRKKHKLTWKQYKHRVTWALKQQL